jgi:hypothetical protein
MHKIDPGLNYPGRRPGFPAPGHNSLYFRRDDLYFTRQEAGRRELSLPPPENFLYKTCLYISFLYIFAS